MDPFFSESNQDLHNMGIVQVNYTCNYCSMFTVNAHVKQTQLSNCPLLRTCYTCNYSSMRLLPVQMESKLSYPPFRFNTQ